MCHMPDGNAAIPQMNFADGKWAHGTTPVQLAKVITNGVPGTAMMAFKDRFSDKEILALAKYVKAFDKSSEARGQGRRKTPKTAVNRSISPVPAPPAVGRSLRSPSTREDEHRTPMAHLNVALIGYAFMGRAHSNAYRQVGRFFSPKHPPRMKVLCGRTPEAVKTAADQLGWEETSTDWHEVVTRKDIDIVDVSTPGDSHAEIAIAAAKAGKVVFCEKPLANTVAGSREDAGGGEEGGRHPHALPQLSPGAGGHAGQGADREGQARDALSLPRHVPAGLDRRSRASRSSGASGRRPPVPARSATSRRIRWTSRDSSSARSRR